jgi:helicase
MKFHGVFIGVDRYQSQGINWLSSAVRDATALHALFTDTFGGNAEILADEAATSKGLRYELARLAQTSTDEDAVVVAFSGHGSSTHAACTARRGPRPARPDFPAAR